MLTIAEMLDERHHLLEIALWMFGSAATADEIVHETYRRWYALDDAERAGIAVPRAWLTRVAGDICRELRASAGPLRAPVGTPEPGRAAGVPVPRSEPVPGSAQRHSDQTRFDRHDQVARRFAAACDTGDAAALKAVLAAGATVVSDGGGKLRAAVRPAYGADVVARFVAALLTGQPGTVLTVESVNGRSGLVWRRAGQAVAVASLSVAEAEVTAVWIVLNPDKLQRWHRR